MSGSTSNRLGAPPRIGGGPGDFAAMERYLRDIYLALVLNGKVLERITAIEARLAKLDAVAAISTAAPASYDQAYTETLRKTLNTIAHPTSNGA